MSYRGTVRDGVVVLPAEAKLPDGTEVQVEPILPQKQIPSFYERYKEFCGIADDMPSDLAENHDHYLHGHPKK